MIPGGVSITRTRCSSCLGTGKIIPHVGGISEVAGYPCLSCNGKGWLELEQKDPKEAEGLHGPSIPDVPGSAPSPSTPAEPPVPKDQKDDDDDED